MKDTSGLCLGCMREKNELGVCSYCGFDLQKYTVLSHHLNPGTILFEKYLIGRVLGEGGFGITYLGWNIDLETAVTIKEYFPAGSVRRNNTKEKEVTVLLGEKEKIYERGKERFFEEARMLGQLQDISGIVQVRDLFRENKTAYIVMEYVEGKDLSEHLEEHGGKLPSTTVFEMMKPLICSLQKVHERGMIHRDISPDNIMILQDGSVKLIDFGIAKQFRDRQEKRSILLKEGYAPMEQYQEDGEQGPWTDVYALCATMYRAITGVTPVFSVERIIKDVANNGSKDTVKTPSELGEEINQNMEKNLMKGMAVLPKERFQSMGELYQAFYETQERERTKTVVFERNMRAVDASFEKMGKEKKNKKFHIVVGMAILAGVSLFFVMQSPKIMYEMARNYSEQRQYNKAVSSYEKVIFLGEKLGEEDYKNQAKKELGDYYYETGQYDEAGACYETVLDWVETDKKTELAKKYYERGKYEKAEKWYEAAGSREGVEKTKKKRADIYFEQGEYEKAISLYETLGCEEEVKKSQEAIAMAYYAQGKYEEAIDWYQRAENQGRILECQLKLGEEYYEKGDYESAIKWYQEAGDEEKTLNSQKLLAEQYYEREEYEKAKTVYEEILRDDKISFFTRLQMNIKLKLCEDKIISK